MSTAFYSVIQFCPDAARQEAVNVGVVLFDTHTGYVGVKFSPTAERIRKFFGNVIDTAQLKVLGESVQQLFERDKMLERDKQLLASADSFRSFGERQANELRFTPPRKIALGHPQTVLESVYQRLVEHSQNRAKRRGVDKRLREEFDQPQFTRLIRRSITVEVESVPVRVPFGYRNGRFHLIQPATFQTDSSDLIRQTAFLHVVGEHVRAEKHPQYGELGLVVVGELMGKQTKAAEEYIRRDMERVRARFYTLSNLNALFQDILAHARPSEVAMQGEIDDGEGLAG